MAETELQIDSLGKYFLKALIDTYGPRLIEAAISLYKETVATLKAGIVAPNNLALNLFSEFSLIDMLHGGAVKGYRTQELASIKRLNMTTAERQYVMNLYGVSQSQIDAADWQLKVTDYSLNIPYPLGWSGMKEVFYEAHNPRVFPKLVSDVVYEKVVGYGDILLKGQSLSGVGGGIKTFVEGVSSIQELAPLGSSALNALKSLRAEPTVPLPTSEGTNQ